MNSKRDNLCQTSAALAVGSTASQISFGAFDYKIAGRAYKKALSASQALVARAGTTPLNVPANSTQVFFFHVDAAGNITFSQARGGPVQVGFVQGLLPSASAPGYTPGAYEWPQEDALTCCIGAVKVATNAAGAFIPGTTLFSAANQVVTYYNVTEDLGVPIPT